MVGRENLARKRAPPGLAALSFVVALAAGPPAWADGLWVPDPAGDLGRTVTAEYRFDKPVTASGTLAVEWTDALGRLVDRRRLAFDLVDQAVIGIPLDLRRAVARQNTLRVQLAPAGAAPRELSASFVVPHGDDEWWDFQILMWQTRTPAQYRAYRNLGISGATLTANRANPANLEPARIAPLLGADYRWMVENIATDFYAPYHRWFPDRPVNWHFNEAKRFYRENNFDPAAFIRSPSLSDAEAFKPIRERLMATVRRHQPYRPFYYVLADEPGIADLTAFWDFDLSEPSLRGMRQWLAAKYGDLANLNRQWGTGFADWAAVVPMTTREAMRRTDDNFSAWADFKAWMDVAFASALRAGTDAVHAAAPRARAGIGGGQLPGWGGFDYSLVAPALDVIELGDFHGNMDMIRLVNPAAIMLTTAYEAGRAEEHRVWRTLLRGARGLVLWDEENDFVTDTGELGPRGRDVAGYYREIRAGLGALLIDSALQVDPVAVLYSQASMRTLWLLEHKPRGDVWLDRDSEAETKDNLFRRASRTMTQTLEGLGLQPQIVPSALLEGDALDRGRYRIVLLPHAVALSPGEAAWLRRFVGDGGIVVVEGDAGTFDDHSRRLPASPLADLLPPENVVAQVRPFGRGGVMRVPVGASPATLRAALQPALAAANIKPPIAIRDAAGQPTQDVSLFRFRVGAWSVLAVQPTTYAAPSAGRTVELVFDRDVTVHDIRAGRPLGRRNSVRVTLPDGGPVILAIAPDEEVAAMSLAGPRDLRQGEIESFEIEAPTRRIVHVEFADPSGQRLPHYARTVRLDRGNARVSLPLAVDDRIGEWQLRVTDPLTGAVARQVFTVAP